MKNILTMCLVGLLLTVSVAGQSGAQREAQPKRETAPQRRKLKLYSKKTGAEVSAKPLVSRSEKLAHPKDKARLFDFNVEIIDVGGLDVVSEKISDDLKSLLITVRNNGAGMPKEETHLVVVVQYYKLSGSPPWAIPIPQFDFTEVTKLPTLKPKEEFVFKIDLVKHGAVLIPDAQYKVGESAPGINVDCYIFPGTLNISL